MKMNELLKVFAEKIKRHENREDGLIAELAIKDEEIALLQREKEETAEEIKKLKKEVVFQKITAHRWYEKYLEVIKKIEALQDEYLKEIKREKEN